MPSINKSALKKDLISNTINSPLAAQLGVAMTAMDTIAAQITNSDIIDGNTNSSIVKRIEKYVSDGIDNETIQSYEQGSEVIKSLFTPIIGKLKEGGKEKDTHKNMDALMETLPVILDKAIGAEELKGLKQDILSIHKDYSQQKKGLFALGSISRDKQEILKTIKKSLDTAIKEDAGQNEVPKVKEVYEKVRETLATESAKIKRGLLGGAKLKHTIEIVMAKCDARISPENHPPVSKPHMKK
jgi:hypothetical protein